MTQALAAVHSTAAGDLGPNLAAFKRHLWAANKSDSTLVTYGKAVEQLAAFLAEAGMPTTVAAVHREHVESFLIDLRERGHRPATVSQRFRSLQQFFKWLADEGEIRESPMARMKPPHVPEEPPPILRKEQLDALYRATAGPDFDARRDHAIIRLFEATGMRRAEIAGLRLADVELYQGRGQYGGAAHVVGKGSRPRACQFDATAATALDRYLRVRAKRRDADSEWLWLGTQGRLGETGIAQVLKRRARQAGIEHIHPHQFRHTFAHQMLSDGMQEGDLMRLAGWRSRQMVSRYGASAADERAAEAYHRIRAGRR